MLDLRPVLAFAAFACLPQSAYADAVIYKGTLGKHPIVVELSAPPDEATEPFAGRYAYLSEGADIPLHLMAKAPGELTLAEEQPCLAESCHDFIEEGQEVAPELGAGWTLVAEADGRLSGSWQPLEGAALPLSLEPVGTKALPEPFDGTAASLAGIVDEIAVGQVALEDSPYDRLRMDVPPEQGEEIVTSGGAYRYVTDPRTKFRYPRITRLDGADASAANNHLEQRHRQMSLSALQCKSQQFRSMNWGGWIPYEAGSLAGYDEEQVEVTYLSSRLMSWVESGSLFCGGAHPYNHINSYTLDLASGQPLDLSQVFSGWVAHEWGEPDKRVDPQTARAEPDAYAWGPDADLAAYIRENRQATDPQFDADCGTEQLIEEYLRISFKQGEVAVFSLEGLPHVISACAGPLLEAPLSELHQFLAPGAADYFPSLGS